MLIVGKAEYTSKLVNRVDSFKRDITWSVEEFKIMIPEEAVPEGHEITVSVHKYSSGHPHFTFPNDKVPISPIYEVSCSQEALQKRVTLKLNLSSHGVRCAGQMCLVTSSRIPDQFVSDWTQTFLPHYHLEPISDEEIKMQDLCGEFHLNKLNCYFAICTTGTF